MELPRTSSTSRDTGRSPRGEEFSPPPWLDDSDEIAAPERPRWGRMRFDLTRAGAGSLIVVGVLGAVLAVLFMFRDGSSGATVGVVPVAETAAPQSAAQLAALGSPEHRGAGEISASSPEPAPLESVPVSVVVSVAGHVHTPGLVELPEGARVADALDRAGGALVDADLITLNLAQKLTDGDQIVVGWRGGDSEHVPNVSLILRAGESPGMSGGHAVGESVGRSGRGSLVNLNTATESELLALPGVGPVTANAIIEWRTQNGAFTDVEQLRNVRGIGPAKLAQIRDHVTV